MSNPSGPPSGDLPSAAQQQPTCPRHPGVVSYVRCQRCERPTCPACQKPAAVGIQCVDCVKEQQRSAPVTRSVFGGRATDGRPYVSIGLIALCALVYVGQLVDDRVTNDLAYQPFIGEEEPWRFVTAAFVHSDAQPMHILFNMYALWICGQYLEPLLGRARFLALYLISAVGGSVGYQLLASVPDSAADAYGSGWFTPTVGASGAVFGLFAAVVVLNRHLGREVTPMLVMIGINAAIPFFIGGIAWQAHLGGAVTGAIAAGAIALLGKERRQMQWVALAGVLAICVGLAIMRYGMVDIPASMVG